MITIRTAIGAGILSAGVALSTVAFGDEGRGSSERPGILPSRESLTYGRNVIGQPVQNREGKVIGHIHELMIDPKDGKIIYGVVDVGEGFLGIGDKRVAIPWNSLNLNPTQSGYLLDVETTGLAKAPASEWEHRRWEAKYFEGTIQEVNPEANTLKAKKMGVSHDFVLPERERLSATTYRPGDEVRIQYSKRKDGSKVVENISLASTASGERSGYRPTARTTEEGVGRDAVENSRTSNEYSGKVEEINPQERTIKIKKMLISHTFKLDEGLPSSTLTRFRVGDEVDIVYADHNGTKVLSQIARATEPRRD